MLLNPKLYEINTRVWLKKSNSKLSDIPFGYFTDLAEKGINIIWLMGIWKNSPNSVDKYCLTNDLIGSYDKALKDWKREDVIGSPYSIDVYDVNPEIGTWNDLFILKTKLNIAGMKLILDFVPNHFSAESSVLMSNPEIFLQVEDNFFQKDSFTFFKSSFNPDLTFAHGRDPLFPAWQDTVQVNFFSQDARDYLISILLKLTQVCDGVRCDMAMLPLNNVFFNTWVGVLNKLGYAKPAEEFWKLAISKVKEKNNDFIFLAEAYWDLEWDLQQLGFDFTYDKRITDRLAANDIQGIISHLKADKDFQLKSARFLENHDENRAISKFGKFRSLAAAVVISTIQGMKFYYDGQFEGKKTKLPVQLSREPEEKFSGTVNKFYLKLLSVIKDDTFTYGQWKLLQPLPAGNGNLLFENFFAWQWSYNNIRKIVIINYSELTGQCRLKFEVPINDDYISLYDQLNERNFERFVSEIRNLGLFIELKGFASHILTFHF
jgi:glycosidase